MIQKCPFVQFFKFFTYYLCSIIYFFEFFDFILLQCHFYCVIFSRFAADSLWLINACAQTAIRFFTAKYEILQLHANGHSFFYSEMRNFNVVPKRPFVLLLRNTKLFQNFNLLFDIKLKNLKLPLFVF